VSSLLGESAELVCAAEGTAVSIAWFSGLESLGTGDLNTDKNGQLVSVYTLPAVSEGSAGEYTCRASSPYSEGHLEAQVFLTVTLPGWFFFKSYSQFRLQYTIHVHAFIFMFSTNL